MAKKELLSYYFRGLNLYILNKQWPFIVGVELLAIFVALFASKLAPTWIFWPPVIEKLR